MSGDPFLFKKEKHRWKRKPSLRVSGRKRLKGQWFVISSVIFVLLLLLAALARVQVQFGAEETTTGQVYENIKAEWPKAIDIIVAENATSAHLESRLATWSEFLSNYTTARAINLSGWAAVGLPYGDIDKKLNVTVINFYGQPLDFNVSIEGQTQNMALGDGNFTTLAFDSVPDYFSVNLTTDENVNFNVSPRVWSVLKLKLIKGRQIWQSIQVD